MCPICQRVFRMIRVALSTLPRAGTIQIADTTHTLATWYVAAKLTTYATTTDAQQVTLAMEEPDAEGFMRGHLCIGSGRDAARWTLDNCRKDDAPGLRLEGMASPVVQTVPDSWMAQAFPGCGWEE
jgi:hypothetical protein